MEETFLKWGFRAELWAASTAMAMFAAYVALDLARGVSSHHRFTAARSLMASSLALSAGTWAAHFIALAGKPLPFELGYDAPLAFGALLLALASSVVGVYMSARPHMGAARIVVAAVALGTGVCVVPVVSLLALRLTPAPHWNLLWFAGGWALACLCAGGALSIVAAQRR